MIRAVRVLIVGRVQGVGYRAWVRDEALSRNLSGWVRNRRDGAVEALFSGEAETVEAMLAACRSGPRLAVVGEVRVLEVEAEPPPPGFRIAETP